MSDRKLEEQGAEPMEEEFEVKSEGHEDLDAAMREALEAVERSEGATSDAAAVEGGAPPAVLADLERQILELREKNARALADFENYRKRVERERADQRRYEGFDVLAELLPVLDNLRRALEASGDVEDLKTGVELIAKQFHDLLRRHGVERVAAVGEPFDPTVHDAVSRDEDPSVDVATVVEEHRSGYMMGERLLRPASVRVATPPDGRDDARADAEDGRETN